MKKPEKQERLKKNKVRKATRAAAGAKKGVNAGGEKVGVPSGAVRIFKKVGETPLEALEAFRKKHPHLGGVPMTYAGRLDPLASGVLLILYGDECKRKEKYLGLDKEYEVEILFGVSTDTYDPLGIVEESAQRGIFSKPEAFEKVDMVMRRFVSEIEKGPHTFMQEYPAYSARAVGGRQLFERARAGKLPEKMPRKRVTIYSCELISKRNISARKLLTDIKKKISVVRGDFRQNEIIKKWRGLLNHENAFFPVYKIKVVCSSGTYMRSLAHRLGKDASIGAIAYSIKRSNLLEVKLLRG